MERRAAVEVKDRMAAVDAIDQEQHPRVRPPPLRKRVDQPGGLEGLCPPRRKPTFSGFD